VLYAFANATSEAGSLNYTYKWYVNGTLYSTGSYTGAASGTELKIANMSGVQTTQSWKIELTANASGDTAAQNSSAAAVDSLVVACGNLSITGASYTLGVSISDIASSCFNLTANSVSLQCNGLSIDGADTAGTAGINVTGFNSSAISGCSISDFDTGIYLSSSNGATITGNNITSHATYGINIQSSATYSIYSNIFNSTTNFNLGGSPTGKWNTTKSAGTNVVGGPYVGGNYWATPAGAGFSQTCLDADTEGICDGAYALGSGNTDSLPLSKITYLSGCASIGTRGSYVLTASVSNSGSTCMQLQANNVVLNCNGSTIDGSSVAGTYGVSLQNYNNSIVKNCIIKEFETSLYVSGSSNNSFTNLSTKSNSNYGVYLSSVSSSTLSQITSASNTQYGIYLDSSSSNSIYNNIFNNTANAFSSGSTNLWNTSKTYGTNIAGGPNIGGNFWANPSATGFSQNCTNADGDGICDSTYTVSAGEIDYLPLTLGNKSTTEFTLNVNISSTNYISVYTSNGTSDSSFSFAPVSFENFTSNISLLSNISANTSGGELGFLVTNDGNTNVSINITSDKSAAQFIGGSSPLFQAFGAVNETGACPSLVASMQDLSTTSVNICPLLISSDSQDTIWAHIKVQISPDSPQGSSSAVITFTSTAV
ncbi:hypothetical protein FJZ26_04995, partial [Candidatus Parvarchaeota archaeon]|nr:hypothetical protein [Candidatus Parvarchaeota archaeon]